MIPYSWDHGILKAVVFAATQKDLSLACPSSSAVSRIAGLPALHELVLLEQFRRPDFTKIELAIKLSLVQLASKLQDMCLDVDSFASTGRIPEQASRTGRMSNPGNQTCRSPSRGAHACSKAPDARDRRLK